MTYTKVCSSNDFSNLNVLEQENFKKTTNKHRRFQIRVYQFFMMRSRDLRHRLMVIRQEERRQELQSIERLKTKFKSRSK